MVEQIEKRSRIIGIAFFLLILFINPFVLQQLTRYPFIYSLVFSFLGMCYYFQIFWLGKKVTASFQYLNSQNCLWLLVVQSIVFLVFLSINNCLKWDPNYAFGGDAPSYIEFDFSSWASILGNLRTFGLPLIIKSYQLVFKDFQPWPYVQMISYVFSIFFLYWCLLSFGFNKIFALLIVSFLLWDKTNFLAFRFIRTESLSATFLHLSVGSMLLAIRNWNWKTAVSLGVSTFFLYQIRPNLSFIAILVPLWAVGISVIKEHFHLAQARNIFFRFSQVTILPLFLFCLLRLLVVGQFGVVSMSGLCLAGHAAHYLNEKSIQYLSGDVRTLADEILVRKRQLTPPNNLSPFEWITFVSEAQKVEMEADAFGADLTIAWNVAIKQIKGVEPFDDPRLKIEAWKTNLMELAIFQFHQHNFKIDRLLMRFSIAVLTREWKRYVHWLLGGSFYGMRIYLESRSFWLICLGYLVIGKLIFLLLCQRLDGAELKRWNQDIKIFMMMAGSLYIFGLIPVVVFNYPFLRLLDLIGIYLLPAFLCFSLPPFWLKREAA